MNFDGIFNILGAIIIVALVIGLVAHPATAGVVTAFGNAFTGAITAARA